MFYSVCLKENTVGFGQYLKYLRAQRDLFDFVFNFGKAAPSRVHNLWPYSQFYLRAQCKQRRVWRSFLIETRVLSRAASSSAGETREKKTR